MTKEKQSRELTEIVKEQILTGKINIKKISDPIIISYDIEQYYGTEICYPSRQLLSDALEKDFYAIMEKGIKNKIKSECPKGYNSYMIGERYGEENSDIFLVRKKAGINKKRIKGGPVGLGGSRWSRVKDDYEYIGLGRPSADKIMIPVIYLSIELNN